MSGSGTGKPTDLTRAALIKNAVPEAPVLIGSGVTPETVSETVAVADGAIVGSKFVKLLANENYLEQIPDFINSIRNT